jgi:hypothetical protein
VRVVELLEEVDIQHDQRDGRVLARPFIESATKLVVEGPAVRKAGERVGAGFGFVGFDFGGLVGELFLGGLEPVLQFGVGGQDLVHGREHGGVSVVGVAIDAGQVGRNGLHLGGMVADVGGHTGGQFGDLGGGRCNAFDGPLHFVGFFLRRAFFYRRGGCGFRRHLCAEEPDASGKADAQRDAGADYIHQQVGANRGRQNKHDDESPGQSTIRAATRSPRAWRAMPPRWDCAWIPLGSFEKVDSD